MRRRQFNQLRAAGIIPPIDAVGRAAWELRRRETENAARRDAEAALLDAMPDASDAPAIWPHDSDKTCPHCGRVIQHQIRLAWHVAACARRHDHDRHSPLMG